MYSFAFVVGVALGGFAVGSLAYQLLAAAVQRAQIGGVQRCIAALESLREDLRAGMGDDPNFKIVESTITGSCCRLRATLTSVQEEWLRMQEQQEKPNAQ